MLKYLAIPLLLLFVFGQSRAQYYANQNKVWVFGDHAGLDFNTGSLVTFYAGGINAIEGSASVSDAGGSLLFYTEGKNVYDASGSLMPSGSAIVPYATASTTQAALIVPVIGNANQYYIFSLEQAFGSSTYSHLSYSKVDMTLGSGVGDLVAGSVGIMLDSNLGEKMIAIPGNDCNIWVMVHRRDSAVFLVYNITSGGIAGLVVSNVGTAVLHRQGALRASPDRSKVVSQSSIGSSKGTELFDFDPTTGIVSNCRVLNASFPNYDAEFSPDNTKLYCTEYPSPYRIVQYDISLTSTSAIVASRTSIASGGGWGTISLAPDGKIYAAKLGGLSCIPTPNAPGTSCGFISTAVSVSGSNGGLPNRYFYVPPASTSYTRHDTLVCPPVSGPITIIAHDSLSGSGYLWNDGTTTTVTKTITGPGDYWVKIYNGCALKIDTIHVVFNFAAGTILGGSGLCAGASTTYTDTAAGGTWSSSNLAVVTIGSSTGIVSGLAVGTAIISYSVPAGCVSVKSLTVNPQPSVPNGSNNVCVGSTIVLTDSISGGTWSTTSSTVSLGSSSGIITGISAGIATITYTLPAGCKTTKTITVNPVPSAITGTASVCVGSTTTLTNTTPGGTWSSSVPGTAAIGTSGIVSGVAAGASMISYTLSTGCTATIVATVNPLPGAITGASTLCVGQTTYLINSGSSTWTSSNPAVATIGSATGLVAGIFTGVLTITYTLPTGCRTTFSMTINPLPAIITGSNSVCSGATITLSDSVVGGAWSSSDIVVATVGVATGIVTGSSAGVATISYTLSTGCGRTKVFTVNPLPESIIGVDSICTGTPIMFYDPTPGGAWSISPITAATITPAGMVTGISAGTATASYSLPTGCYVTMPIIVNTGPAAISGPSAICLGLTGTFTSTTTGGIWGSSAPAIAPVFGTGIATGAAIGVATISYTIGVCSATKPVTVNSSPGPITGPNHVCIGSTIAMANAIPGGSWSATPTTTATVNPTSGVVTGIAAGVVTVTYSLGAGCTVTTSVTVNPLPGAITGTISICQGATTTLTCPGGGTWSVSAGAGVASVGSTTGIVSGTSAGIATIDYTLAGCSRTINVTVNPLPTVFSITGGGSYCSGGSGVHIGLSGSSIGTSYKLYMGTTLVGAAIAGTGASIDFGLFTTVGVYTITATTTATSCSRAMTGSVTITINPLPVPFTVSGGGSYCAGGAGLHITLGGSVAGTTYQLYNGTTPVGTTITGTGGTLDFGYQTAAGTYTVTATISATGCTRTMTGSATIVINPLPSPISGPTAVCLGATIAQTDATTGGSWASSTPTIATIGSTSGIVAGITIGTTPITYTLPTGCYITTTINVTTAPLPISGSSTVCAGSTTPFTDATAGGLWTSSNTTIASVGSLSGIVTGASVGTATISYSLGSGCTVIKPVTVNAGPAAISGATSICAGSTASYTDATTGGTWSSSPTTTATISGTGIATGVAAGTVTISYSVAGCSATKAVTINATAAPIGGPASVCMGASVTETNTVAGGTWSSTSSTITIGSSGIVTGITAGTASITYAIGSCAITSTITVNSNPTISGATGLCMRTTTTLTSTTTGGVWSVSAGAGVASVGATTGIVTGLTPGTATITYVLPTGCSRQVTVTVNTAPGAITGSLSVCLGQATTLSNTAGGGIWSTGAGSVSIGSSSGVVTGIAAGAAPVTYSLGSGCTVTAIVTVNATPAAIAGATHLCQGTTTIVTDPTTGGVWTSTTPSVATISTSGTITGITPGTTTINYTLTTGCNASMTITVDPPPAAIAGVNTLCAGLSSSYNSISTGGTWSCAPATIATITPTGSLTAISAGVATITYTLSTGCTATKAVTITTAPSPITGSSAMCVGTSTTLTDATTGGTWSSSTPSVASITTTGTVTGLAVGTTTISYTVGGCPAIKNVTVNSLPGTITGTSIVCIGATITLTNATPGGTWGSSNILIATIGSASGIVTGISAGTATITYSLGVGCTVTRTVTVNSLPPAISGTLHVCIGATTTLSDPVTGGTWSSTIPSVATISSTGVVTGLSDGSSTISYTTGSGCAATATMTVIYVPMITVVHNMCAWNDTMTVNDSNTTGLYTSTLVTIANLGSGAGKITSHAPGTATVTYILPSGCSRTASFVVNPLPATISGTGPVCTGGTRTLTDPTTGGTWSSSVGSGSVGSTSGVVTGISAGIVHITYTVLTTGCRVDTALTVYATPTAITGPASVLIGTPITLSDAVTGGVWTSSNPAKATVGATTGIVNGISTGSVTITYTTGTICIAAKPIAVMPPSSGHKGPDSPDSHREEESGSGVRNITIAPNPNQGTFTLDVTWDKEEQLDVAIIDIAGQTIQHLTATTTNGLKSIPIKMNVPAGLYTLSIRSSSSNSTLQVIVAP